ncbi:MAG: LacI family DNA-binding transcriptional regulator, partial [Thermotogota bacterium]
TNKKLETEVSAIRLMELNSVDYMILAPEGYKSDHLDLLRERGFDFLSFGVHFEDKNYPEVYTDDYEGGKSVGSYFGEIGVKHPLLLMGNPRKTNTIDRESGFLTGFEASGGNPADVIIEHLSVNVTFSEAFFLQKKDAFNFDSVFCYNDLMAMGAISAFRKLEIIPGKDIPIIGYDDVFYAKVLGLSTVKIPIKEMIRKSVEIIINNKREKAQFKTSLIIRETA